MTRIIACIVLALCLASIAFAQSTEPLPRFEAADVRVSPRSVNPQTGGGFIRGGRYQFRKATMVDLISSAYGVEPDKVHGGPSWLESDRFDIVAKAPANTTNETAKLMLRSLLADRFKLVLHNEDKPVTAYALTVAKGGPKMKESAAGATQCQGVPQTPAPGVVPYSVVACRCITMEVLAQVLPQLASAYFANPVMDRTELKGFFEFELKWTGRGQLAAAGADGITIFDAVEKQLGLKLDLQTKPSPVIVVDNVSPKPTDNVPEIAKLLPPISTEFEVADIKPSMPNGPQQGNIQPSGRIDLQGLPLKQIMLIAWDTAEDLIVGPKWMETERFDVVAKAPSDVSISGVNVDVDTLRGMLRALLIDRFKITTHTEEQPVNAFTLLANNRETRMKKADPSSRSVCKRNTNTANRNPALGVGFTCTNTTMAQLAERLAGMAPGYIQGHPVVDVTGLEDGWDFPLQWSGRGVIDAAVRAAESGPAGGVSADPNGALTLFEAIEKQLGLKLEQQKQRLPVMVIDHIERTPTEN